MKTIIDYKELSEFTKGNFTFSRISEDTIKVSGKIKLLVVTKEISTTIKVERVGYSSITFSSGDPGLVSSGLMFLSSKAKKAIADLGGGSIKIDLKAIPELSEVTNLLKLDSIRFEEEGVKIEISLRP